MLAFNDTKNLSVNDLFDLFNSVGWVSDTNGAILQSAILHSTNVITAWADNKLVGLIRSMDDGCWHANIDCLVVHKDFQKQGIGSQLVSRLLEKLSDIETISVSPNERKNSKLYTKFGFKEVEDDCLLQKYQ